MNQAKTVRIGIAGMGTVGQGVWKHLRSRSDLLNTRSGIKFTITKVAVKDLQKKRAVKIPEAKLSTDPLALAKDPDIDILCELMGGTRLALKVVETALQAGKVVVTANKALLCDHGDHLFRVAQAHGGRIYYEASVAGGIPIIKALREGLVVNRFPLIYGILNGTCNYILTRMQREGKTFDEIVGDARKLGYVEADERLDLDGIDAAHKTVIVAFLAHGKWIPLKKMPVEGIRDVSLEDIEWAEKLGFKIKLLGVILRDFKSNHVFASVQPTLVPKNMVLANVDEVFNAVSVTGDVVGESIYIGRGAGQDATASAVISDIVDAAQFILSEPVDQTLPEEANLDLANLSQVHGAFYIRLSVKDQPGVLAEVASILAQKNISIESVLQRPNGTTKSSVLVLTTHTTTEAAMQETCKALQSHKAVLKKPFLLRIADFEQNLS